mmetsp:Transcript_74008/g.149114  ORF Transcript_74008/g.149114 Transcript_74008/m.149114 type:complete len:378 (-) Transcript_74008:68-1201(-)
MAGTSEIAKRSAYLVHLHVPLALRLEPLDPLIVLDAFALAHALEHGEHARHHALEAAKVHVRAVVEAGEHVIGVLLHLVLDVHLAPLHVVLLPAEGVVELEVVGERRGDALEFVVVEERVRVGHAEEEPAQALVVRARLGLLDEEALPEGAEGGNAGARGHHDDVGLGGGFRHEHHFARRPSHLHLGAGGRVAQVVGAHALLGRVVLPHGLVPVGGAAHAEGGLLTRHVVTVTGRSDRVQAHPVGLPVLWVGPGGDHAERLAFPVRHVTSVVDNNVAGLAGRLWANNALRRHHFAHERGLRLECVDRDAGLIVVWRSLQEILCGGGRGGDGGGAALTESSHSIWEPRVAHVERFGLATDRRWKESIGCAESESQNYC